MRATARMAPVVSSTLPARRRMIRDVEPMKSTTMRNWCWRTLLGYSVVLLIAGFAISLVLVKTVVPPKNFSLPSQSPYDPYFILGSALLMMIAPIAAVLLSWRLREFLMAFAIATGLLMGNLGYGLGFTPLCAIVYLVVNKVAEVLIFYFPRNTEQDRAPDGDEPPN